MIEMNVTKVKESWLCTGCGTCSGVCPQNAIEMIYSSKYRTFVPTIDRKKCIECGICIKVCPGLEVDFHKIESALIGSGKRSKYLGRVMESDLAFASNARLRYAASSGGVVTALIKYLIKSGDYDEAVVTCMAGTKPIPVITNRMKVIESAKGSKYCPVSLNQILKKIKPDKKTIIVGLPCHIQGIRKAQLEALIPTENLLLIGLFCGSNYGFDATDYLLSSNNLKRQDITELSYRGSGWPGKIGIKLKNNKEKKIPMEDFYGTASFFGVWRCGLCADGTAELADLSVGDAWLKRIADKDKNGTSIVLIRTAKGKSSFYKALKTKHICAEKIETNEAINSQVKMLENKKTIVLARMKMAQLRFRKTPFYHTELGPVTAKSFVSELKKFFATNFVKTIKKTRTTEIAYVWVRQMVRRFLKI